MKNVHAGAAFTMPALQLLRLRGAAGSRIVCASGLLLVTAADDPRDVELAALDGYLIPNNGLVLMEAVRDSTVRLERPARRGWRQPVMTGGFDLKSVVGSQAGPAPGSPAVLDSTHKHG
jgi:hypothetical protein